MEATSLKLPYPEYSRYVLGGKMREVFTYDILTDSFVVRWDTIIDNVQYHWMDSLNSSSNERIEDKSIMEQKRNKAFKFFTELENDSI